MYRLLFACRRAGVGAHACVRVSFNVGDDSLFSWESVVDQSTLLSVRPTWGSKRACLCVRACPSTSAMTRLIVWEKALCRSKTTHLKKHFRPYL